MRRILIIRLSAIGDVAMATALLPPLRERWPDARITWLVEPAAEPLIRHNPHIDEVVVSPRLRWSRLWRERRLVALALAVRDFRRRLRAGRFDLVLDTQGLLKSGLPAWFTGARERIGIGSGEGSAMLMTRVVDRDRDDAAMGSEYRALADELGLDRSEFRMDIEPGAQAREEARALLGELIVTGGYAVACPFTTRPQKHWLEERWAALIARIRQELQLPVVVLGGPGDAAAAERLAARAPVHNLVGRTPLATTTAVLENAALVVGVDTGLTHVGIGWGRPTVALFGATRPYLRTPSDRAQILYEPLACSPCRRRPTCGGAFTCMRRHSVDDVMTAARHALEAAA